LDLNFRLRYLDASYVCERVRKENIKAEHEEEREKEHEEEEIEKEAE
jgi:hypothetical protein